MNKRIRNSSPILVAGEKLLELASQMPKGSEPNNLARSLKHLLDLPDNFNDAFSERGWVFVEFCCGHEPAAFALAMKQEGRSAEDIDAFLSDSLINIEPLYWQSMRVLSGGAAEPAHPIRAAVTDRAFRAYREGDYIAAVPLLLMLVDGFSLGKTGTKSIFSDLAELDHLFEDELSIGGHPSALKAALKEMVRSKKGYSEENVSIPYRHGILHGTRLNYYSKEVATKALGILAAVIEWSNDSSQKPKDELSKERWNRSFLQNFFSKFPSDSPDQSLNLLQSALADRKFNEVVALINYHPVFTNLQSQLLEWKEILASCVIQIDRLEDWEMFGNQARSQINIRVIIDEQTIEIGTYTILSERQVAMKAIDLPDVWQIDLSVVGAIRSRLAKIGIKI